MATQKNPARSEARMLYWQTVSPEEKSARMRRMAKMKSKKMTAAEKSAHGKMMRAARNKK